MGLGPLWRNAQARCCYEIASLWVRLRQYEAAANAYSKALVYRPDDAHIRFLRAWNLTQVPHRRPESIAEFQELLRAAESSGGYYLLGCALQQEARYEEAVHAFREAVRLDDNTGADLHFNCGCSLKALGRLEEAIDEFRQSAQLDPSDAERWALLGATLSEANRWKDAALCQERAVRLSPSALNRIDLAWTLYELDRLAEAEGVARDMLTVDAQCVDARELLVAVLTGQDRFDEAIALALETCRLNPGTPSMRSVMAVALAESGQLDAALHEATAASELAPSDVRCWAALGSVYLAMNDGAHALAAFERMATAIDPATPEVSSTRARCHAGRGAALGLLDRHRDALVEFEALLRTDPEFFDRWPSQAHYYQRSLQTVERERAS